MAVGDLHLALRRHDAPAVRRARGLKRGKTAKPPLYALALKRNYRRNLEPEALHENRVDLLLKHRGDCIGVRRVL